MAFIYCEGLLAVGLRAVEGLSVGRAGRKLGAASLAGSGNFTPNVQPLETDFGIPCDDLRIGHALLWFINSSGIHHIRALAIVKRDPFGRAICLIGTN